MIAVDELRIVMNRGAGIVYTILNIVSHDRTCTP